MKTIIKIVDINGEALALFPEQKEGKMYINSYMHIGQHSLAHMSWMNEKNIHNRLDAIELIEELKSIGYNIQLIED